MPDVKGTGGIVRATIHITRAATGITETFELVGAATEEEAAQLLAEARGKTHHGSAGAVVGQGAKVTNG